MGKAEGNEARRNYETASRLHELADAIEFWDWQVETCEESGTEEPRRITLNLVLKRLP